MMENLEVVLNGRALRTSVSFLPRYELLFFVKVWNKKLIQLNLSSPHSEVPESLTQMYPWFSSLTNRNYYQTSYYYFSTCGTPPPSLLRITKESVDVAAELTVLMDISCVSLRISSLTPRKHFTNCRQGESTAFLINGIALINCSTT